MRELPKKWGLGQFADLRLGGLGKKVGGGGGIFNKGGLYPNPHYGMVESHFYLRYLFVPE